MIFLTGYQFLEQIYEGSNSLVCRMVRQEDQCNVIVKILKIEYPTSEQLQRFKQEYEITKSLQIDGVIKVYGLEKYQRTSALIMEDFQGQSLKKILLLSSLSVEEFLEIAVKIITTLEQIHRANLIHKDLNSTNILYDRKTREVKIIDFGLSDFFNKENKYLKTDIILEGRLDYISPEQTGRVNNKGYDYRTDFYSLGVTFYEMLTGLLPFESDDSLELIHAHLTKKPPAPSTINPQIPVVISDIVMKLMAKKPENRYQSAWGLKYDLEKALQQLKKQGFINKFPLQTTDISDRFEISDKLYGRNKIVTTLRQHWQNVGKKSPPEMLLIGGYSGAGKSTLIKRAYQNIEKGFFLSGKFDQFQRNIPYTAIISAFRDLVRQKLKETPQQLTYWKNKLLVNLGNNGQLIIDVIPEIELVIGKQPPLTPLGAVEAENRFNLVFQKFIESCTEKTAPIVMFLDDLQWCDTATIKLIELILLNNRLDNFLLVGAYRSNEVNENHSLMTMVERVKFNHGMIREFYIDNLTLDDVNFLIADSLNTDIDTVKSLGDLVFQKTRGNAFFTHQFLQTLYLKDLIFFNYNHYQWHWNIDDIVRENITDNVISLMIQQLKILPDTVQDLLKISACLGNTFSLSTLTIVTNKPIDSLQELLVIPIESNLLLPFRDDNNEICYQFLHDRIQQAIYELIGEENKPQIHLNIGNILLSQRDTVTADILEIVGHFNQAIDLIEELSLRETVAKLNLEAGKKAKNAHAYSASTVYIDIGLSLLRDDCWQCQYQLTLDLHIANAEIAYLNGDFVKMEAMTEIVLSHSKDILHKVEVYLISVASKADRRMIVDAVKMGRQALRELGVNLPHQPNPENMAEVLSKVIDKLHNRDIEDLLYLPPMTDRRAMAVMKLLGILSIPFFQGMPELMPFLAAEMVSLSIDFGNTSASALGYGVYGLVLSNFLGEVERGFRFGKMAIDLINQSHQLQFKALTLNLYSGCIHHHQRSIHEVLPLLKENYLLSVETGDTMTTACILVYGFTSFFAGVDLVRLDDELASYHEVLGEFKQYSAQIYIDIAWQTVKNLRENPADMDMLTGSIYDERVMLTKHAEELELTAIAQVYIYKLLLAYHFGQRRRALDYLHQVKPYLMTVSSIMFCAVYHFYSALTHISLLSPENQGELLTEIEYHQQCLKMWADNAPMNYLGKWYLVEAEKQRVLGNKAEAIDNYDLAIQFAQDHNFISDNALSHELAGNFYLQWGKLKLAEIYLQESYYSYSLWGAGAKLVYLEEKYPQIFNRINPDNKSSLGSSSSNNSLDLATVMKVSQAITGEIILTNLLQTLMTILLENVGVKKGCLLLYHSELEGEMGEFTIAVDSRGDSLNLYPQQSLQDTLPESILYYVARTREYVNIQHPSHYGYFVNDNYIKSIQPQSILCYPLVTQGDLMGIIYLESELDINISDHSRLELLQLISGQAASALRNAQLYQEVKQQEKLLKQFLEGMPVAVGVLNAEGKPFYANQKAVEILGKGVLPNVSAQKISEAYNTYIHNTNKPYPNENLALIRALHGEVWHNDDIDIHRGDKIIPIECWANPIYDEQGKVKYAMTVFQDISERKKAEQILKDYNRTLEIEVLRRTYELEKVNQELSQLANLDGLTQIPNRRRFDDYLAQEWEKHRCSHNNLSLLLIDIDYFKLYNDFYGHQQGDDCLIKVAQTMQKTLQRPSDLIARYGGEEFAVILPHTDTAGAHLVATRIQNAIDNLHIPHEKSKVSNNITLSIGGACLIPQGDVNMNCLINFADTALYRVKGEGRWGIRIYRM
ncbi:MAG: diguanylate cyclase [Cyanobacterium sp. T60_A2020_053]|nr:diguanylate cyclase [Cyanobacterium sp. T60_A2020_053]